MMNVKTLNFCLIFILFLFIGGCAELQKSTLYYDNRIPLSRRYQARALEYEKINEPQLALYYYKIAYTFYPQNKDLEKKLNELKQKNLNEAEKHFQLGMVAYKNNESESAKKEFLITLRYYSEHKEAARYLKQLSAAPVYSSYTVQKEDTFKKISQDAYRSAKLDFFIAEYNDLDAKTRPNPGQTIKIPVVETKFIDLEPPPKIQIKTEETKPKKEIRGIDIEKELADARNFFALNDFANSLTVCEKILKFDPANTEAIELKNLANLQIGISLTNAKNYFQAIKVLNKVDSGFPGLDPAIANVKIGMIQEAETHYLTGVIHFNNKKYRSAILEWAKALTYNPNHQKAKEDITKARKLIKD
ncbi:MAG: LysM peptidoglycan-binding domain-containing protein [Desulfobacteraceae bacterium]|nr:MAG: LysM peptidoglycan-binding domain-containing protein [Desulfobacteraceae bacterium]